MDLFWIESTIYAFFDIPMYDSRVSVISVLIKEWGLTTGRIIYRSFEQTRNACFTVRLTRACTQSTRDVEGQDVILSPNLCSVNQTNPNKVKRVHRIGNNAGISNIFINYMSIEL